MPVELSILMYPNHRLLLLLACKAVLNTMMSHDCGFRMSAAWRWVVCEMKQCVNAGAQVNTITKKYYSFCDGGNMSAQFSLTTITI